MTITVQLPDSIGSRLFSNGQEPTRAVLEVLALEGYRSGRLPESDVRQLLGLETRTEVHEFLKEHEAFMHYTLEDLDHDGAVALQVAQHVQRQREAGSAQPNE